jgi:hypothetical protein
MVFSWDLVQVAGRCPFYCSGGAGTGRRAAVFGLGIKMSVLLFRIIAITISGEGERESVTAG